MMRTYKSSMSQSQPLSLSIRSQNMSRQQAKELERRKKQYQKYLQSKFSPILTQSEPSNEYQEQLNLQQAVLQALNESDKFLNDFLKKLQEAREKHSPKQEMMEKRLQVEDWYRGALSACKEIQQIEDTKSDQRGRIKELETEDLQREFLTNAAAAARREREFADADKEKRLAEIRAQQTLLDQRIADANARLAKERTAERVEVTQLQKQQKQAQPPFPMEELEEILLQLFDQVKRDNEELSSFQLPKMRVTNLVMHLRAIQSFVPENIQRKLTINEAIKQQQTLFSEYKVEMERLIHEQNGPTIENPFVVEFDIALQLIKKYLELLPLANFPELAAMKKLFYTDLSKFQLKLIESQRK